MKPLYMWAGGKNKMISKYQDTPGIPYSGYETYVEPFFGGGAMMIHIASKNKNLKFVLNDINTEIVGLYTAIKHDHISFMKECDLLVDKYLPLDKPDRKEYFYEVRESYIKDYINWNQTKESATLYFLMKTAFNGIFQTTKSANGRFATPSGLLNQKTTVYDKINVNEWNEFLQVVDIKSGDWKSCVDHNQAFFFFDPPYRGSFTQYSQVFDDKDHIDLIDFSKKADISGNYVFYCNRDTSDDFYQKHRGHLIEKQYDVVYTAGRRSTEDGKKEAKKAKEILLYSPRLEKYRSLF